MDATASLALAQGGGWLSIDGCGCIDHAPFSLFVLFMRINQNFIEVNGCGFCLSVYERTVLCCQDRSGASLVSASRNPKGPLVGGCFNTKPMYFSIRAKVSVLHREVGRSWEGLLREAPLYDVVITPIGRLTCPQYTTHSVLILISPHPLLCVYV